MSRFNAETVRMAGFYPILIPLAQCRVSGEGLAAGIPLAAGWVRGILAGWLAGWLAPPGSHPWAVVSSLVHARPRWAERGSLAACCSLPH
jgi:hypothetical protein